ncbi:MAG: hypothetical protein KBC46_03320 [Ferrovibrio sp.]|nr:hypothetical protein [Ferrovibrio sp.]
MPDTAAAATADKAFAFLPALRVAIAYEVIYQLARKHVTALAGDAALTRIIFFIGYSAGYEFGLSDASIPPEERSTELPRDIAAALDERREGRLYEALSGYMARDRQTARPKWRPPFAGAGIAHVGEAGPEAVLPMGRR